MVDELGRNPEREEIEAQIDFLMITCEVSVLKNDSVVRSCVELALAGKIDEAISKLTSYNNTALMQNHYYVQENCPAANYPSPEVNDSYASAQEVNRLIEHFKMLKFQAEKPV
jgi:hypothetical protein